MVAMSSPQSPPPVDPNYQMEAFTGYVKAAPLALNSRPNVSNTDVKSLTLGIVNRRAGGYGISAATALEKFRLLQLLVGLAREPAIAGVAPLAYTSICCNVDFACELHRDSHKSCDRESRAVAIGDSRAGSCSWKPGRTTERTAPLNTRGCAAWRWT